MAEANLTAALLRKQFSYDPLTGVFIRIGESAPSGRIATKGYRQIWMKPSRYMAHRLAWLYVYGEWPTDFIDHINQIKDDNRIENLRVVTRKQNRENITKFGHNTSGHRGVSVKARNGTFQADIRHHGRTIYLGNFDNIDDAITARLRAERDIFTHAPITQKITHIPLQAPVCASFDGGPGHQAGMINCQLLLDIADESA